MTNDSLFSASLISPSIHESFPKGYSIRPLERNDYHKGFFDCLATLTWVANVSEERFNAQFDWFKTRGEDWYYCAVIEHEGKIVGTGVVVIERKL
jgi:glucosamine-phosphate N-acetyltransferase